MTLIVEDGNGLAAAESYITVAFLKSYHKDRGAEVSGTTPELEAALRLATEYFEIRWGPKVPGVLLDQDQALSFPTTYFQDPLPVPLLRSIAEYGLFVITGDLFINNDRVTDGGGIIRLLETVGPISTETAYSGSGLGSIMGKWPVLPKADSLARQVVITSVGGVIR